MKRNKKNQIRISLNEKAKEMGEGSLSPRRIIIKIGEYLKTDDPILKDCEIALQDLMAAAFDFPNIL